MDGWMGLSEIPVDFYPLPITVGERRPVALESSLNTGGRRVDWMGG